MASAPTATPSVIHPALAAVVRLLPLVDLAILGLGAFAFSLLWWVDREHSPSRLSALSRRGEILLSAGHGLLGVVLLAASIILEDTLALRLTARGEGVAPVSLCILLAYLGFSSLALAFSAWRSRPAPVLGRYHPFLAAVAAGALLLLDALSPLPVRRVMLLPALGAVSLLSAGLALWQYWGLRHAGGRTVREGAGEGEHTLVPRGGRSGGEPALPAGFPPELLHRYSDPEVIGIGGVSRVYRAKRRETGMVVAVKVPLAMDEATGMSFLREMRGWETLGHDNIARVLGANILPVPYVEMEYLPGSVAGLQKPVEVRTAARITAGIARGLAFAHGRGIIHRDLKPSNILLTEGLEPKIADWGLSRFLGGPTAADVSGFSPRYAAPEQLDPGRYGEPDRRTDIYGAGCVFYEMVTGKPPFGGGSIAEVKGRVLTTAPDPPSALNPAAGPLDGIILRCLEKDPADRYQTAAELERDLLGFLGGSRQGP